MNHIFLSFSRSLDCGSGNAVQHRTHPHTVQPTAKQQKEQARAQRSVSLHPAEACPTLLYAREVPSKPQPHCKRPCDPPTAVDQSGDRGEACLARCATRARRQWPSPGTWSCNNKSKTGGKGKSTDGLCFSIPNGNNTGIWSTMKHIRQGTSNAKSRNNNRFFVSIFCGSKPVISAPRAVRACGRLQHAPACVPGHPRSPRVGACSMPQHAGACSILECPYAPSC